MAGRFGASYFQQRTAAHRLNIILFQFREKSNRSRATAVSVPVQAAAAGE
jgi:hypothetical protein